MSSFYPISYNPTNTPIEGTVQYGKLVLGILPQDYSSEFGGLQWWSTPDLNNRYVIAFPDENCSQSTPIEGLNSCVGFWGTTEKNEQSFLNLINSLSLDGKPTSFSSSTDAHNWLLSNGYWSSYEESILPSMEITGIKTVYVKYDIL
jgi:hypothetical protein